MSRTDVRPIGIAQFAPDLEAAENGDLDCVGISGYWADEEQHLLENLNRPGFPGGQTLETLESWRSGCRQSAPEGTPQLHRHRFAVDGPLSRDRPLRNAITACDAGRRTDELDISGCHPLGHIKDDPPTLALSSRQTGSGRSQLRL